MRSPGRNVRGSLCCPFGVCLPCRKCGSLHPLRRNGVAVSPIETQSLNSEGRQKAALTFRPRLRAPRPRRRPRSGLWRRLPACVRERDLRSFQAQRWRSLLSPSAFIDRVGNVDGVWTESAGAPPTWGWPLRILSFRFLTRSFSFFAFALHSLGRPVPGVSRQGALFAAALLCHKTPQI